MWLQYLVSKYRNNEILEKITTVQAYYREEHSYISINSGKYIIECATEAGCKDFFREIISRLGDSTAVIKDDIVTDLGGLIDD